MTSDEASQQSPSSDLVLLWSQEFDAQVGSPADEEFWSHQTGDGSQYGLTGWGNHELEFYLPENTVTDGKSNLVITAKRTDASTAPDAYYGKAEFTSGRIVTAAKLHFEYGRYEIRAKVPGGVGLWPAFWMLGDNIAELRWPYCGEIDIMEFIGRKPNEILGTLHGPGYFGDDGHGAVHRVSEPVAEDWHVFTIDWKPDHIIWYLDGKRFFEASAETVAPNEWVFNHPFYFLLNLAVGGHLGGTLDPNLPDESQLLVDWIRVYEIDGFGRVFKPDHWDELQPKA